MLAVVVAPCYVSSLVVLTVAVALFCLDHAYSLDIAVVPYVSSLVY